MASLTDITETTQDENSSTLPSSSRSILLKGNDYLSNTDKNNIPSDIATETENRDLGNTK